MNACLPGQEFVFSDGKMVSTVEALINHIKEIPPGTYTFHVSNGKNDFYNWLHYCVDKELAEEVKGNLSQRMMVEKLTGHSWHSEHKKKHKY